MADESEPPAASDTSRDTVDLEWLRGTKPETEHLEQLGIELLDADVGRVVMAMPRRGWMVNPGGSIAGGVIADLIDTACAPAILSALGEWPDRLETTELNVSYVRPASEEIQAEAEVVRIGASLAVIEVEVTGRSPEGDRKVVATGRTTYQIGS